MSVPNQTPYIIYNANGLTTVFPFEFYIINASDIQVTINGTLVTSGYSVSGVGNVGGGDVIFVTPPTNGVVVMLERVVPTYRLTDYQDNGDLLADTVNKDFDRLWMAIQRAFINLGLALRRPLFGGPYNAEGYRISGLGDPVDDSDAVNKRWFLQQNQLNLSKTLRVPDGAISQLPGVAARKNKIVGMNNDGQPVMLLPESGSAADVMLEFASSEDGKGDALVAVKQPFAGAATRTQHEKNTDLISVKDFGAIGDGVHDDTTAIQAAIDALLPAGGVVYLPKGQYKIIDDLKVTNMPVIFRGDGMYSTVVEQYTPGKNGITFTSNTVNNAPSTDSLLINSLQIGDMSINRGAGSGGNAVSAVWKEMTSNSPQAIFERFRVYSKTDAGRCWAGGLELRNCNGLKISTIQIHGNPLETQSSTSDPYTMRFGIRLSNDSGGSLGLISFFIDKMTIIAAGVGIDIYGWHEGVEICNSEIVQVAIGIRVQGDATHQNPDLFYLNSHIEARIVCATLSNVFKAKFTACDLFQYAAVGNTGAIIELNGCTAFSCTGSTLSMQRGSGTYTVTGIVADTSYHGNVSGCTFIGVDNGIDVLKDSWNIGDNVFYLVVNPIRLYGNFHTLGVNKYTSCTNKVLYVGTGHQITPIQFTGSHILVVTVAGSQQGFTVPIPAGVFTSAPDMGVAVPIGGSTSILFSCSYNRSLSTATSAKFEVTGSASIPNGSYVFSINLLSRP